MQLYRAGRLEAGEAVRVHLSARPSSCKPRDRWLAQEQAACCGSAEPKSQECCGSLLDFLPIIDYIPITCS
jgi:hypothetical protein